MIFSGFIFLDKAANFFEKTIKFTIIMTGFLLRYDIIMSQG